MQGEKQTIPQREMHATLSTQTPASIALTPFPLSIDIASYSFFLNLLIIAISKHTSNWQQ